MNRAPRSSTPFPYTTLFRSDLLDREMRGVLVVALGDGPGEPVRHPDLFSFPCFFACTSPRWKIASPIGVAATAMISSGHTSAHTSPVPLTIEARSPRSAYVAGDSFEISCIQCGMTDTG